MTDRSSAPGLRTVQPATAELVQPCPPWCERPAGHGWEDGTSSGDLVRYHWRTFPFPDTDHGSLMVIATEYHTATGMRRDPESYVVDTGIGGDCGLDAAGIRGMVSVLAEALSLTDESPAPPRPFRSPLR
ncbi:hypothetical protein [Nocardia transvalensis]|uniref:hypothetical protein n=1 Tax=Nocardia transvalensis TaxID=37333 RepID=UPI00189504CE|nr:hypothetical protein [Nocardia transvalensis]MBF6332332.1 hypothetical protein [Nocardia transvalensis]